MKKLGFLLIILAAFLLLPMTVFAEGEETTEEVVAEETTDSNEVNLYFFRGEGCSHCAEAEAWFESIEEEYGSYFKIVDYETWYDEENSNLMQQVAEARGETAEGVPYIIIDDKSWNGFADEYKDEILEQIKTVYAQNVEDRYDIMKYLETGNTNKKADEESSSSDVLALILILLVSGGLVFGVYKARQNA